VSLLGFAVGGAFLGLLHYDLPYYLAAIVVLAEAEMRERRAMPASPTVKDVPTSQETQRV
jgi:hypothetical protein